MIKDLILKNRTYRRFYQSERISEQQLIATEYTIVGLQILGMQNNQIIELLASTP